MNPFSESHRRLAALAEIASDDRMTQRSLASVLEISLGLANALLRGLESDRLVRVNAEAGSEVPRYAITRAGRSVMRRLARSFAAEAVALLKKSLGRRAPPAFAHPPSSRFAGLRRTRASTSVEAGADKPADKRARRLSGGGPSKFRQRCPALLRPRRARRNYAEPEPGRTGRRTKAKNCVSQTTMKRGAKRGR